ncbi:MAG: hypothetical protein NXI24_13790 [bacterium]|nr:hypothetical protein [bacterium]
MDGRRLRQLRRLIETVHAALRREAIVAFGRTAPNPTVAAAVVAETPGGLKIFSGATEAPGGRHAEIAALEAYEAYEAAGDSFPGRMYVTLEPCSHHGRTPPCTDRILKYPQLKKLIVFTADPSLPESGCELLRAAGRTVIMRRPPDEQKDASHRNVRGGRRAARFLDGFHSRIAGKGPRLHYKIAATADDILGRRNRRYVISGERALQIGQLLRAKLDAVLVGPGTVATDAPSLALRPESLVTSAPEERSGRGDWFWDSLFENEAAVRAAIAEDAAGYQPARVFILGRPSSTAAEFLQRQWQVTIASGRLPVFAALPGCRALWMPLFQALRDADGFEAEAAAAADRSPGAGPRPAEYLAAFDGAGLPESPALEDPAFAQRLREWLGALGYNEVMIEGGAGLLSALQAGALTQDRIYVLRSKRRFEELPDLDADLGADVDPATDGVRLPEWMGRASLGAAYDLGADRLEVRRPS